VKAPASFVESKRHEQFMALLGVGLPVAPRRASSGTAEQPLHGHPPDQRAAQPPGGSALSDDGWEECPSPVQIEASDVCGEGAVLDSVEQPAHLQAEADGARDARQPDDDSASSAGSWEDLLAQASILPVGAGAQGGSEDCGFAVTQPASSVPCNGGWEACVSLRQARVAHGQEISS